MPESIFQITRASEVLNKYVMGLWSDNFTAAFCVKLIVTVLFLTVPLHPNSAPQNAYSSPQWLFLKKYFDITAHPEAKWPSQQNVLIFVFYFTIFLVPIADTISTEPSLESLQCHLESVWLKNGMRPIIKIPLLKWSINANNAGVSTAFLTQLHCMAETWFSEGFDMKVPW